MSSRHSTRNKILAYLACVEEKRSAGRICRFMWEQHGIRPGTTRTMLWRLVKDGRVRSLGKGYYQMMLCLLFLTIAVMCADLWAHWKV